MSCRSSHDKEGADVQLGERKIGIITVDEEDGDRSFFFEMKVPVERHVPARLPSPAVRKRQADDRRAHEKDRLGGTQQRARTMRIF